MLIFFFSFFKIKIFPPTTDKGSERSKKKKKTLQLAAIDWKPEFQERLAMGLYRLSKKAESGQAHQALESCSTTTGLQHS
jgi:hypothetical protein